MERGKHVDDYLNWQYDIPGGHINIEFDDKRAVAAIECYSDDKRSRCPAIRGVNDGISENDAVRKLGTPSHSQIDGVAKSLFYDASGITLWLTQQQVYMLEVRVPGYTSRLAVSR